MEWLIDIIKEWVADQAYATEAWVLAKAYATEAWVLEKLYLQKAEYPGYGMPIHVTGDPTPDITCTYFRCGDYEGNPCYSREDGSYFIWRSGVNWRIATSVGGGPLIRKFYRTDPSIYGDYTPEIGSSGTPTVAPGYKYLTTSFVDRGDPGAADFAVGDFVKDGAWHDLDLSSIVPVGAKIVLFSVGLKASAVSREFLLRKKGNVNFWNRCWARTFIADMWTTYDKECPCDSNRFVQYWATSFNITGIHVTVKGWWF